MKNISIYLATTHELRLEFLEVADLIAKLNKVYNRDGINLRLIPHNEDMGTLEECELCLTLYHTEFGNYSKKDFESAYAALQKDASNPKKIYVFFKDTQDISDELQTFKNSFVTDYGHFFCRFENVDSMKLEFLMQLQLYQNKGYAQEFKIENQYVVLGDEKFISLNSIPFAALNRDYIRLRDGLAQVNEKILKYPDDDDFKKERLALEKEFTQIQDSLFDTALHFTKLFNHTISDRIKEARMAFENGNLEKALFMLEDTEADGKAILNKHKILKSQLHENTNNIKLLIEEHILKAKITFADNIRFIGSTAFIQTIKTVNNLYIQAFNLALEINDEKNEMIDLLEQYIDFLSRASDSNTFISLDPEYPSDLTSEEIEEVYHDIDWQIVMVQKNRLYMQKKYEEYVALSEKFYGVAALQTARGYNILGCFHGSCGKHNEARVCLNKALEIYKKNEYIDSFALIDVYKNISISYECQNNFLSSLKNINKAIKMLIHTCGIDNVKTLNNIRDKMLTVNRIALEFFESGLFDKAERFFMYELQIYKKYFADKNYDLKDYYDMTDIANTLLCLGMLNENKQKIDISLKLYLESFSIYSNESAYSYETYNVSLRISMLYAEHKKFTNALKFLYKSIEYYDIHWGEDENEKKFIDYCNQLDLKHKHQCYYTKEFEYYIKSLELSEELFDEMHMAQLYLKIGDLYTKVPDIAKSIKYYTKALHIREAQLGLEHKDTLVCREKLELLA